MKKIVWCSLFSMVACATNETKKQHSPTSTAGKYSPLFRALSSKTNEQKNQHNDDLECPPSELSEIIANKKTTQKLKK